jgi:hypothetical protein
MSWATESDLNPEAVEEEAQWMAEQKPDRERAAG